MASSRAILADITNLGLDPTKHHRNVNSTGHIKNAGVSTLSVDLVPVVAPVQNVVAQTTEVEPTSDQVTTEPVSETEVTETQPVDEKKAKKPNKKASQKA